VKKYKRKSKGKEGGGHLPLHASPPLKRGKSIYFGIGMHFFITLILQLKFAVDKKGE
jgi:hypothetical protein